MEDPLRDVLVDFYRKYRRLPGLHFSRRQNARQEEDWAPSILA